MLTTFGRLLSTAKVTRTGTVTYDNRSLEELVKQLQATVDVLAARVRELEAAACNRSDAVSSRHEVAFSKGVIK